MEQLFLRCDNIADDELKEVSSFVDCIAEELSIGWVRPPIPIRGIQVLAKAIKNRDRSVTAVSSDAINALLYKIS